MALKTDSETKLDALIGDKTDGAFHNFQEFYRTYHSYVRNVLYRLGVGPDLDDIVQNTFIKSWLKISKFEKRSKIKTWLTKIAVNSAYDYLRKPKLAVLRLIEPVNQKGPSEDFENRETIYKALNALTLEHRLVIVLCIMEEHSLQEAADILKVPVGTVKSRLSRGRESMQSIITNIRSYHES